MTRRGLLIILSSPSGAGKSTLAKRLRAWDETLQFSVSATTRAARAGEVDGQDYYFVSKEGFDTLVAEGGMLEHATVFENAYGSPKAPVQDAIEQGCDVLFDIDWQGAQQINNSSLSENVLSIFILPPSITELHRRLVSRGQDSDEVISGRMQKSMNEISRWGEYDFVLINDDLDQTEDALKTIISAERLRRNRQPHLVDHVRTLETQFGELA
ncbi:MAG: guanylate kinase [Pseudomonadota bacterium]